MIPLFGVAFLVSLDFTYVLADDHGWLTALAVWLLLIAVGLVLIEIAAALNKRREAGRA